MPYRGARPLWRSFSVVFKPVGGLPQLVEQGLRQIGMGGLKLLHQLAGLTAVVAAEQCLAPVEREEDVAGALYLLQYLEGRQDIAVVLGFAGGVVEQAEQGRKIMKEAAEQKAANMPEAMIQNIANGRLQKFFKEKTLNEQVLALGDGKETVAQYLKRMDPEVKVLCFRRFSLSD